MASFRRAGPHMCERCSCLIFILGSNARGPRELLDFLADDRCRTIVLGGDIVDALSLAKRFFWTDGHTQVLRIAAGSAAAGVRLVYLPGNHDAALALFVEMLQGQIEVHREWVYRTGRGERLPGAARRPV